MIKGAFVPKKIKKPAASSAYKDKYEEHKANIRRLNNPSYNLVSSQPKVCRKRKPKFQNIVWVNKKGSKETKQYSTSQNKKNQYSNGNDIKNFHVSKAKGKPRNKEVVPAEQLSLDKRDLSKKTRRKRKRKRKKKYTENRQVKKLKEHESVSKEEVVDLTTAAAPEVDLTKQKTEPVVNFIPKKRPYFHPEIKKYLSSITKFLEQDHSTKRNLRRSTRKNNLYSDFVSFKTKNEKLHKKENSEKVKKRKRGRTFFPEPEETGFKSSFDRSRNDVKLDMNKVYRDAIHLGEQIRIRKQEKPKKQEEMLNEAKLRFLFQSKLDELTPKFSKTNRKFIHFLRKYGKFKFKKIYEQITANPISGADCMQILGLRHSDSSNTIKEKVKTLRFVCHPDKNTHPDANAWLSSINEAYSSLCE
eukprot:snap_masked-scaffold_126-processed-gene-0.5-mRNA-1 protein AED:1.00 eAED:1.00 QI:0/-1/0/0/-1/1/1/0/414